MASGDAFFEIMALLRKRDDLCKEWLRHIMEEVEHGRITTEESMRQMASVKAEMRKTSEAMARMEEYVRNLKIEDKNDRKSSEKDK